MPRILSDSFTRANASTLGANWTLGAGFIGPLGILSNGVKDTTGDGSAEAVECYSAVTVPPTQFSQAVIGGTVAVDTHAVVVHCAIVGTDKNLYAAGHSFAVFGDTKYRIWRISSGTNTSLTVHASQTVQAGDVVRLETTPSASVGNLLVLFVNGIRLLSVNDKVVPTGYPGLYARHTSATDVLYDGWSGGSLGPLTQHSLSAVPESPYTDFSGRRLAGVIIPPETVALAETIQRMLGRATSETLNVGDSLFLPTGRRTQHGLSATPTRLYGLFSGRPQGTTPTTIHETLSFVETLHRLLVRRVIAEAPALVEVHLRLTAPVPLRESVSLVETLGAVQGTFRRVTQAGLSATPQRLYGDFTNRSTSKFRNISESLLLADALVRLSAPAKTAEVATLAESLTSLAVKPRTIPAEALSVSETVLYVVAHQLVPETLLLAESLTSGKIRSFAEALALSEQIASQLLGPQGPPETLSLAETLAALGSSGGALTKALSDALLLGSETLIPAIQKVFQESMTLVEALTAITVRLETLAPDTLSLAETWVPLILRPRSESLLVVEGLQRRVSRPPVVDTLLLNETWSPVYVATKGKSGLPWRFDNISVGNIVVGSSPGSLALPELDGPLAPTIDNDRKIYIFTGDGSLIYHVGTTRYKISATIF